jgi:protein involved in sex pheromone biosynthesis
MRIYSIFIVCFLLSGCKNNSTQNNSITETTTHSIDTTASIVTATVSEDNAYQQTALYLAGLATDADKKINPSIIQNDAYRLFSDSLSRGFENMETSRLSKMRTGLKQSS